MTHQKQNYIRSYDDTKPPAANLGVDGFMKLMSSDKFKLDLFPMHLDMETGEVYSFINVNTLSPTSLPAYFFVKDGCSMLAITFSAIHDPFFYPARY